MSVIHHKKSPYSLSMLKLMPISMPMAHPQRTKRKWLSRASYTLLLASSAAVMSGCQSNKSLDSSNHSSAALIDFSVVNPAVMQAQSEAFNQSLQAHDERYEQLFDQTRFPNSDSQAKRHLISAIRQHLATEHVAVAQANYNAVPFIDADSIDAGSTGLLRTFLEVYGHREAQENDDYENHSDYDYDNYDNYNDYESHNETAADAVSAAADFEVAYEADGYEYDSDGYDIDGYDEYGYDRSGYDYDGFDEEGYDKEGYDYYGETAEGYNNGSRDTSLRARIASNNPKQ